MWCACNTGVKLALRTSVPVVMLVGSSWSSIELYGRFRAGSGKKEVPVWNVVSSLPSSLTLFLPFLPSFLLSSLPFPLCPFSVLGSPLNSTRDLGSAVSFFSRSRQSLGVKRFWVHSGFKIMLFMIAPLQKFSDNQIMKFCKTRDVVLGLGHHLSYFLCYCMF